MAPVQPLRIQRQSEPIVPQTFQKIATTPTKDVKIAREGIALEPSCTSSDSPFMPRRMSVWAGRDPHPDAGRDRDHRRSNTSSTRASASTSTAPSTTTRRPRPTSITMRPGADARASRRRKTGSGVAIGSGASTVGTKAGGRLAADTLDFQRPSPRQKLKAGDPVPPCRRRHQPGRRQAFHNDAELLGLRPPTSATPTRRSRGRSAETQCLLLSISTVSTAPPPSHKTAYAAWVLLAMPNRRLTPPEIASLSELKSEILKSLRLSSSISRTIPKPGSSIISSAS